MKVFKFSMWVPHSGKYENYWKCPPTTDEVIQRLKEENPEDTDACKRFVDQRLRLINEGEFNITEEEVKEN